MEEAHNQGLRTSATMMFGHIETIEERLEHLRRLRELQDRTKGFTAFIPWPFQPDHTALNDLVTIEKTTGFAYLRMLALSRIYLDNFDNIQASWVTQGPKIAQLSLSFGANDFGSTMIEENVVAAAGVITSYSIHYTKLYEFSYYTDLLEGIKEVRPDVHIQAFTCVEIAHLAGLADKPVGETLEILKAAGLGSIPGGGAEVFAPRIREITCEKKLPGKDWIEVASYNFV